MRNRSSVFLVASLVVLAGCPRSDPPPPTVSPPVVEEVELRLLVVDDERLAAAARTYLETRGAKVTVTSITADDLLTRSKPGADVIVYPSGLIGELAERNWLVPLPAETLGDPAAKTADFLRMLRQSEAKWGAAALAMPLGSPQFTLVYRADVLGSLGLRPPETWTEYRELAERLARREELGSLAPPADAPWYGTLEPLAPGWAGQMLLARAAPYVQDRGELSTLFDHRTMQPLIDRPPFVRALEELATAAKLGPPDRDALTPAEVRRRFLQGQAALAICWPAGKLTDKFAAELALGFAELPGSREVFRLDGERWRTRQPEESGRIPLLGVAGRMVSAVRGGATRYALQLVVLLTGSEAGEELSAASSFTAPFRVSQLHRPEAWLTGLERRFAAEYGEVLKQQADRDSWVHSPRIPGRKAYLDALDVAVAQTLQEDPVAPAAALDEAAKKWRTITEAHGQEAQQRAHVRSHGLEP